MSSCIHIVQSIQYNLKLGKVRYVEFWALDIIVISFDCDVRIKDFSGFSCDNGFT